MMVPFMLFVKLKIGSKISKLKLFSLFIVLTMSLITTKLAIAHHGEFKICNNSNNTYYIALTYKTGFNVIFGDWITRGHYKIRENSCRIIWKPFSAAGNIFVGVRKEGFFWDSEVKFRKGQYSSPGMSSSSVERYFCTLNDNFKREDSTLDSLSSCGGKYSDKQLFSIYLNFLSSDEGRILYLD